MPKPPTDPFDKLIAPHLATLFRTAFRLAGNVADAEDLVQDVCAACCANFTGLAAADHPDRWLVRVLFNRFIDGGRRRQRSPIVALNSEFDASASSSDAPGPAELAEQSEREQRFELAWARLKENHRMLLSLRAEGYGLAEIEEITGVSKTVLRARLQRARQSLARHLDKSATETGEEPRLRSAT